MYHVFHGLNAILTTLLLTQRDPLIVAGIDMKWKCALMKREESFKDAKSRETLNFT